MSTAAEVRGAAEEKTERVTFRAEESQLEALERLVDDGIYKDRSKAIRHGIDKILESEVEADV